jgi:hypothetical protein
MAVRAIRRSDEAMPCRENSNVDVVVRSMLWVPTAPRRLAAFPLFLPFFPLLPLFLVVARSGGHRGGGASRFSFQTSTPPLMSPVTGRAPGPNPVTMMAGFQISYAGANKAPAYSSFVESGASSLGAGSSASASAWMLPPLPGRRSSGASAAVRGRGGALMSGRGGALLSPLGFSFRRSGGEQAGAREEVMTEKNADEEMGLELTLGNAETRKDRA